MWLTILFRKVNLPKAAFILLFKALYVLKGYLKVLFPHIKAPVSLSAYIYTYAWMYIHMYTICDVLIAFDLLKSGTLMQVVLDKTSMNS